MKDLHKRSYTAALLIMLVIVASLLSPKILGMLVVFCMIYTLYVEWPRFKMFWLTPFYPVLPFISLIYQTVYYPTWFFIMLILICTLDSGAYFFGNLYGRTKLAPTISPGKTIEGLLGGAVCSVVIALIIYYLGYFPVTSILEALIATLILVIAGTAGDLFESFLKRRAHIKDSGTILPGHGGVLDRLDSLLGGALGLITIHFLL